MVDDWMRKYHVLAGQAHFKAPEPRHEEPVVVKPAPPAVVDDTPAAEPARKPVRKRTVKKELNDAAEKPKRKPATKKPVAKRKPASRKPE
jgi:hypothetical protein